MKSNDVKRGTVAVLGIGVGIANAIVLIALVCLADFIVLRTMIFSRTITLLLVLAGVLFVLFLVLGKLARSLRARSAGADKVAFEGLGHAAAIMNSPEIPAEDSKGNPLVIRIVMSVLFVAGVAVITIVAWIFSNAAWRSFELSFGAVVAAEWLVYYWIGPLNRFVNKAVGVGGLSESSGRGNA